VERSSGGLGRAASGDVPVTQVRPILDRTSQPYGLSFSDRHFSNFFRDRTSEKSVVKSDNKVRTAASGWRTAALGLLPSGGGQQPSLFFCFLVELRQLFCRVPQLLYSFHTSQPYGLSFSDRHFSNFFRDRTSEKSDVTSDNKVRTAASGWRTAALGLLPSGGGQ